jgi:hypothetical protein
LHRLRSACLGQARGFSLLGHHRRECRFGLFGLLEPTSFRCQASLVCQPRCCCSASLVCTSFFLLLPRELGLPGGLLFLPSELGLSGSFLSLPSDFCLSGSFRSGRCLDPRRLGFAFLLGLPFGFHATRLFRLPCFFHATRFLGHAFVFRLSSCLGGTCLDRKDRARLSSRAAGSRSHLSL